MKLHGWDTVSISSIARINDELTANAEKLLTRFDFEHDGLTIEGRFGPWQVRSGGSVGLIHIELPIEQGTLDGVPGKSKQDIAGVTCLVEIALRLMPASDGSGRRELRFDFDPEQSEQGSALVAPLRTIDANDKLDEMSRSLLINVVAACVAAHGSSVSYVFASVGAADPSHTTWLTPRHSEWCYLQTGNDAFLAILNMVEDRPTDGLARAVDPALLSGGGHAFFAIDPQLFLKNVLAPYMTSAFRGGGAFQYAAKSHDVRNRKGIALPTMKRGVATIKPVIEHMKLSISDGKLIAVSNSKSDVRAPLTHGKFYCDVTTRMPFAFDVKSRRLSFRPDPKPKESHRFELPPVLQFLVGWLVNLILQANKKPIAAMVTSVAKRMQVMNTPPPAMLGWSGKRGFEVTAAKLDGCFWFADQRQ